jgi:hypothetical protein
MAAFVRGSERSGRVPLLDLGHRYSSSPDLGGAEGGEGRRCRRLRDLLQLPTKIRTSAPSSPDLSVLARSQALGRRTAAAPLAARNHRDWGVAYPLIVAPRGGRGMTPTAAMVASTAATATSHLPDLRVEREGSGRERQVGIRMILNLCGVETGA